MSENRYKWTRRDEHDLLWYCNQGQTVFEGSKMGGQFEQASVLSRDSSGRLIQSRQSFEQKHWNACSRAIRNGQPLPDGLTVRPLSTGDPGEPSYCPDDICLMRYARISRRVMLLDHQPRRVLLAYFGPTGDRWGHRKGGRIYVIYPMTATGQIVLGEQASKMRNPMEILWKKQQRDYKRTQPQWTEAFDQMDDEARVLLRQAEHAYANVT